jgi:hypothetical protein
MKRAAKAAAQLSWCAHNFDLCRKHCRQINVCTTAAATAAAAATSLLLLVLLLLSLLLLCILCAFDVCRPSLLYVSLYQCGISRYCKQAIATL